MGRNSCFCPSVLQELPAGSGWDVMGTAEGLSPPSPGAAGDGTGLSSLRGSETPHSPSASGSTTLFSFVFPFFFMFVQLEMTNLFQRTPVKNNVFMSLPQLARVCAGNAGNLSAATCKHRRWTSCTAHEHVLLSPGKQLFPYFISSSFPLFPICEGFQIPLKVRSCFCKITYSSDT